MTRVFVRPATVSDVPSMVAHVLRHSAESGVEGDAHFTPNRSPAAEDVRSGLVTRWARTLAEPMWGRAWLLCEGRNVVGHVELRGGRLVEELHRAVLGMGIERPFRGRGHGRELMDRALAWARDVPGLAYVDLGVFAHNGPARRLYTAAGFVETGLVREAFRLADGTAIDDVPMTLDLRAPPAMTQPPKAQPQKGQPPDPSDAPPT